MNRTTGLFAAVVWGTLFCTLATADTTVFFSGCQVYTLVSSDITSDTISSNGYLFTYTRDKLFTGGTGHVIGRPVRVDWPSGVEAQAVTTPPPGVTDYKARIVLERVDAQVFDLKAFTFQLLANTGGAGASIEVVPFLDGEEVLPDPVVFDATGYYGSTFSYDTSPNPFGSTAILTGFDKYDISLYVDYALVALTLDSAAPGDQSCCLPDATCADLTASACTLQGGTALGGGTSCACNACIAPAAPPPVPDGANATLPLLADRLTAAGDSIQMSWDASSCPAGGYNLLYGDLGNVSAYLLSGAVCSMPLNGGRTWSGVPTGNLYFLMVGTDGAGTEGSWGLDGAHLERNGSLPSGECGVTVKDASATCP